MNIPAQAIIVTAIKIADIRLRIVVARPRKVLRGFRRGWLVWRRWNDAPGKDQSLKNPIIERVSALFSK